VTIAPPAAEVLRHAASWHLFARLELLGSRVAAAVLRRRALDDGGDAQFRGLYVSNGDVERLLLRSVGTGTDAPRDDDAAEAVEREADRLEDEGYAFPLRNLQRDLDLDDADVEILLAVLAPDLEPRFGPLYAYLQDDVNLRRAGGALALELALGPEATLTERWRLGPAGPLSRRHLLSVAHDADVPYLTRPLTVHGRVAAHLLGDTAPAPAVRRLLVSPAHLPVDPRHEVARVLASPPDLVYVRDEAGTGLAAAAAGLRLHASDAVVVDLRGITDEDDATEVAAAVALEAALVAGAVVAGPADYASVTGSIVEALSEEPVTLVVVGRRPWDARWARRAPVVVNAPVLSRADRALLWDRELGTHAAAVDAPGVTAHLRLTPDHIAEAARAAVVHAALEDRGVMASDLLEAVRLQCSSGLERLARRVDPVATWDDLVVTERVSLALRDLGERMRHREQVTNEWGMGRSSSKGKGVVALLTGPSGTGKTLAAEVLARDLGLTLYVVDLSAVVDKYVGETEKNLDRIFDEADHVDALVLFDEADALFGKRSRIDDARDRYANVEVAYLLQRMEAFDGFALLTTNLRGNLDDAFARRLDAIVELALPDEDARMRVWQMNLPPRLPLSDDVDLPFLARFTVSGGNIRNACVAAAFGAAAGARCVGMADLVQGVAQEYAKLGRLCIEEEFGPYYYLVKPCSSAQRSAPPSEARGGRGSVTPAQASGEAESI
jgi:hypothetical protein